MTDDTIAFRDADAGDVPALVALVTSAYRGESSRAGWTTEADLIDLREDLIAWYERRGYRRTGIKKPFPAVDPRFGLPRRDDLRFEVLEKGLQHG